MLFTGFVFGQAYKHFAGVIGLASLTAFIGMEIGSTAAMLVARYIFKDIVHDYTKDHKQFIAIDKVIKKKGAKIMFLLRLTPLVPFNFLNYGVGISSITVKDFMIGNCGMIPEMLVLIYIGSAFSNLK